MTNHYMTGNEIRASYLKFFEDRGHSIVPSSSLIPKGDPTLLLTTAGMVQFKPYFLGEETPPNRRLASCQKSFRTTDIESVGDANHLTFFEMLGNFSIGDYFKKETITWAWEFVTKVLALPPERLWITVFLDDDEAADIWKSIGVSESRIVRFGEKDNFWGPAGASGPCGPCSEIHYDFGTDVGCRQPTCVLGCRCGRFSEIWNLVFTQYNQDAQGHRTLLPRPNIDTGMGLERITTVMQNKLSVYETDLFAPLVTCVSEIAGKKYGLDSVTDVNMRIVAEHGRGITFLISDGVMPSNEGRGYVLRRLIRRAILFGRRLNPNGSFLVDVSKTAIEKMGNTYPEIVKCRDFILKVISDEETRFRKTLETGLEHLDGIIELLRIKGEKIISGENVFRLYDTYGFPVEITKEIAETRGYDIDLTGFNTEMERQRERARAASRFEVEQMMVGGEREESTEFTGYDAYEADTRIVKIIVKGKPVDSIKEGEDAGIILEQTPFYGEMGGQVGDTGRIIFSGNEFEVTNTVHAPRGIVIHQGMMSKGSLATDETVKAVVDRERRLDISRNHTATHLLHSALRKALGEQAQQKGSLVAPDRLRFDFSQLAPVAREELEKIQRLVNEEIRRNSGVVCEVMPYKKAIGSGATALFDEKYGDTVRVVKVSDPPVSTELCGGTHVSSTGEIGFFQILAETSVGAGLRRIEAVTGKGAEEYIRQKLATLDKIAGLVSATSDIEDKVSSVVLERDNEKKLRESLERALSQKVAESLLAKVQSVNGIKVLAEIVPPTRIEILREMTDQLKDELQSAVIVLGTVQDDRPLFLAVVTPDLVEKGFNAGNIVKKVAQVTGGGGGGKPNLAQAGGRNKDKMVEAISLVKTLVGGGA